MSTQYFRITSLRLQYRLLSLYCLVVWKYVILIRLVYDVVQFFSVTVQSWQVYDAFSVLKSVQI